MSDECQGDIRKPLSDRGAGALLQKTDRSCLLCPIAIPRESSVARPPRFSERIIAMVISRGHHDEGTRQADSPHRVDSEAGS